MTLPCTLLSRPKRHLRTTDNYLRCRYHDAGIVREGIQGQGDAEFSTGVRPTTRMFNAIKLINYQRGGAGNIGKSPQIRPADGTPRHSSDIIPETALRQPQENYHTGVCIHILLVIWIKSLSQSQRGGEGNVHKEKHGGHSHSPDRKGPLEKIKHALHLDKDKKTEPSPLSQEDKH